VLTDLLTVAAGGRHPEMSLMLATLPVAGWSGTLADRFAAQQGNQAGRGLVRAKTGSLSSVNALSGMVTTRSGHLLAFAFLSVGEPDIDRARKGLDAMATALAGCGCG
jgi:D-alanyl-D-alanine carboxypeptidase/D-alanyl-D-alanine-endopeptidase (penicillin-binding protein 4)